MVFTLVHANLLAIYSRILQFTHISGDKINHCNINPVYVVIRNYKYIDI